jgi:hypothetical protein
MSKRAVLVLALAAVFFSVPVAALAWHGSKTITSFSGTVSSPGTLTGKISVGSIPANTHLTMVDAFQAVPDTGSNANRFYRGTYHFTFTNCTGGTATGGTETIGAGGANPGNPPTNSGAPTFTLASNSTSMTCDYTVTFVGTAPTGSITAVKNVVWMMFNGSVQSLFSATGTPNPVVPEAPMAILVPLTGMTAVGGALLLIRRRSAGTSPKSAT